MEVPATRFLPDASLNPSRDLAYVGYRLATLSALPPSVNVPRVRLADAGFFSRGQRDEVICYSCGLRHSGWMPGDDPMTVHRRLSPQCEHVLQRDRETTELNGGPTTANATTTVTTVTAAAAATTTTSTSTTSGVTASVAATSSTVSVSPAPRPSSVSSSAPSSRPVFPQPRLQLGNAAHPSQCNMYDRRRTFTQWDENQKPPLDEIVFSGFFYAGYADCTVCFYCGIRLKNWRETDNVLVEHVGHSPNCGYLREIKGEDFIHELQRQAS